MTSSNVQAQAQKAFTLDINSQSSEQTRHIGLCLGALLRGGELILLDGQLGAGKTTLTQGLARGMRITEIVNSPTFTLLKEYLGQPVPVPAAPQQNPQTGALALYHFDIYRLDEPEEMFDLGFEDYFSSSGVCVVEWANRAEEFWPAERLYIRLKTLSETSRNLLFVATGARYYELLQQFQITLHPEEWESESAGDAIPKV